MNSYTVLSNASEVQVSQILGAVEHHGLCILPEFVAGGTLDKLNEEFEQILSPDKKNGVDLIELNAGRGAVAHLYELGEAVPNTQAFFGTEWMQEASDTYWGAPARLNDNVYVMEEVPGTEHVAQDLHFDVLKTLKFFLYLNDVTAENGAFSCVPGSHHHTRKLREQLGDDISYEKRCLTRDHPFGENDVVSIEGKAGTLIVFTTEVWHRAGKVSRDTRRVMRGHTRRGEAPPGPKTKNAKKQNKAKANTVSLKSRMKTFCRKISRKS